MKTFKELNQDLQLDIKRLYMESFQLDEKSLQDILHDLFHFKKSNRVSEISAGQD